MNDGLNGIIALVELVALLFALSWFYSWASSQKQKKEMEIINKFKLKNFSLHKSPIFHNPRFAEMLAIDKTKKQIGFWYC